MAGCIWQPLPTLSPDLKMNNYPIPTHQINAFNSIPLDLTRNSISISLPAPNPGVLLTVPRQAFSVRMTVGKWPSTSPQLVETCAAAALLPGAPQPCPTRHPRPSHQSTYGCVNLYLINIHCPPEGPADRVLLPTCHCFPLRFLRPTRVALGSHWQ